MTDVLVRIDVADSQSESKLFEAVDQFASRKYKDDHLTNGCVDAPAIMIKTMPDGNLTQKIIIFQDQASADEFLFVWRQCRKVS